MSPAFIRINLTYPSLILLHHFIKFIHLPPCDSLFQGSNVNYAFPVFESPPPPGSPFHIIPHHSQPSTREHCTLYHCTTAKLMMKWVKLVYQCLVNHIITLTLVPIMLGILVRTIRLGPDNQLPLLWQPWDHRFDAVPVVLIAAVYFISKRRRTGFLVDYACFRPPFTCRSL
ncbi:hypothetical protein SAY87_013297 [Trapa incisa]|uniref:Uncharacterized protein n=1 Tax=Trapa incisa TaxID=236973 RepID=A0AAN7KEV0_9MYRT|nr:hypothetical protein SAY87_013297 [Trapa incisa]